ncbi:RHS repeat-associated core domain-containing protein [Denitromonas iodatirespirans]|uniref:RHS repeat protein n=1 Tax=Denitromonas iodatirespirans TaxID=2795389 RepID=A0A944DCU2_DENI1|nr:RHS repeat-associated core domain-containing protein [Denitromonas iodatirespirans]MBT0962731.1 RHS repeat protein [Denitromonas iodatirespirans]
MDENVVAGWLLFDSNGEIDRYDAQGNLTSIHNTFGMKWEIIRNDAGRIIAIANDFGVEAKLQYDDLHHVASINLPDGSRIGYTYDSGGNLSSVQYPDGSSRTYHYNEASFNGGKNQPHSLTGIDDESGNRYVSYWYDMSLRAIAEELTGGVDRAGLKFSTGKTTVTDALGTVRDYHFEPVNRVARYKSQSQPAGAGCNASTAALTYDPNGNVATRTSFDGTVTTYTHDLTRNLETRRIEASGTADARTISTEWHPDWHLRSAQAEPKLITRWIYNGQSDPVSGGTASCAPSDAEVIEGMPIAVVCKKVEQPTTDANGAAGFAATADGPARVWSYTYNRYGKVLTADGPRADVADLWTYEYYAADATCPGAGEGTGMDKGCRGELLRATDPAGLVTDYLKYNAHGQLLQMRAPNGVITSYAYDLRQRLTAQEVGGLLTSFDYDPRGLLERLTLPDGTAIDYTYDAAHRLTDITHAATGERIHYTLDAAGNRTAETVFDATGTAVRSLARNFDALGRLWKEVRSVNGQAAETVYLHDAEDRLTHATDPLTHTSQWQYNRLGQLKAEIDALNHTTALTPDAAGNTTAVQAANGATTQYTVNGLGEVIQEVSPDRGTRTYHYDAAGNLTAITKGTGYNLPPEQYIESDPRGGYILTAFDALNRPTATRFVTPLGAEEARISTTWDTAPNGAGQIARLAGPDATLDWAYDSLGRVSSQTQTLGAVALTLGTAYDADGRLQSLTYPSGRVLQLSYDSAGRVSGLAFTPYQIASNIAYHPFGGIKAITLLNGIVHHRGQDTNGWPQGYTLGEQPLDFGYDLAGRVTGLDQNGTAYDQGFGYDAADRLTSYTGYPALRAYTYDANGNRTRLTAGSASIDTQYNSGTNKMFMESGLAALPGGVFSAFQTQHWNSYDSAGNFVGQSHTLHYNIAGQLASVTSGGNAVTYQYDGLGRRVSKSGPTMLVPGGFVRYVYDAAHHLVGEYKADGTPIKEYVWIGDLPVAMIETHPDSTTTAYAIETDHLGTPRLLTDATRAPRWRWTSPPFGEVLPEDDPSGLGAVTFNLRFPGQYYDKETGLHYNWNRYYDPGTGRYVQSDPIGLQGGWNTYGYVGGNPVSRIDPFGLAEEGFLGGESGNPPVGLPNPSVEAQRQLARHLTRMLSEIRDRFCPPDGQCPPCRTVSGRIVPVGTIAYRPLDVIPDDVMQHGVYGSHHNIFVAKQNPNNCQCFWQKQKYVLKPGELPPKAIPIEPFVN